MNARRTLGMLGCSLVAVLAGCSAGVGGPGEPQQEKVGHTSEALIWTDPVAPQAFPPNGKNDCSSLAPWYMLNSPYSYANGPSWQYAENYYAYPVVNGTDDPNRTAYSHAYSYQEQNPLNAQLASDFFGIPNANGYKYQVAQITETVTQVFGRNVYHLAQSSAFWYLEGVGSVQQGWTMYPSTSTTNPPWCLIGGCATGTAHFDGNSHPPDGSNGQGADWAQLWNLAWTYSYGTPQDGGKVGPNNPASQVIASTHHQCSFIYACPGGQACSTDPNYWVGCPSGQTCMNDTNDPGQHCGASCWNPATLSPFQNDGVTFYNPAGLVPIDFFVASEKHDPWGPNW
jgi:hypothetical protein